jgi:predicted Mrr-cat superfamily restriction endonuclease
MLKKNVEQIEGFFRLWLRPGGEIDCLPYCLKKNEINIGWADIPGLTDRTLTRADYTNACRSSRYHSTDKDQRRAGYTAGQLWLFIRELEIGDIVVVPHKSEPRLVYFAKVTGPAEYENGHIHGTNLCNYYRRVRWLNKKAPLPASKLPIKLRQAVFAQATIRNLSKFSSHLQKIIER